MTWNVENMLPVGAAGGPRTQDELDAKIASLAALIDDAQPDLLGLQEVGPDSMLALLQGALSHAMPHRAVSDRPDGRGIRVAALSRLPIAETLQIHELAPGLAPVQVGDLDGPGAAGATMDELERGMLGVRVEAEGADVTMVVAHLKSKLLSYPGGRFAPRDEGERARVGAYALNRRGAEAASARTALNGLLEGEGRDRAVLFVGDLNDGPEAATTQILLGPGGSEIGTAGFARPDKGDADRMWNLAPLLPEDGRFTRVYRGRGELIDHILCSRRMLDALPEVATVGPAGPPRSVTDDPRREQGKPGSDHAAVLAVFELAETPVADRASARRGAVA
jgi:endonuclease/exonuclease/phosphatase family metal-dependent hydrolase